MRSRNMGRYLTVIILLFTLFSCSKHKSLIEEHNLSGNFEWYYSFDSPTTSQSFEEVDDQFGIRIKKSGRVIFFKNGEKHKNYRIVSISENNGDVTVEYRIDKFKNGSLIYSSDKITLANWPFDEHQNEFLKVNE